MVLEILTSGPCTSGCAVLRSSRSPTIIATPWWAPLERREQFAAVAGARIARYLDQPDAAELRAALRDLSEAVQLAG